jgi:hypothetical protein
MINAAVINKLRICAIALAAGLALSTTTIAQAHGGGGHGGGAYGGRGGHGGSFGGGHGGRGSYAGRRGGYGYARFDYGGFGYYGGFGVLGYGLFFDALPLSYSTLWWAGSPYYYANDNYYQWNGAVSLYETVRPPRDLASQVATTQAPENLNLFDFNLFAYPKNAQATEQQATDRIECQHWATDQTGINPPQGDSTATVAASPAKRQDLLRAQSACLEGRGYSVQ